MNISSQRHFTPEASRRFRTVVALLAALALSACAGGGFGDIFEDDQPVANERAGEITGTVQYVDTVEREIVLEADRQDLRATLRNAGDRVVLHYDERTVVEYRGQRHQPADLERGDRIEAWVDESRGDLWVQQIDVLYDSTGEGTVADRGYPDTLRGTVHYLDEQRNVMQIRRPGQDTVDIYYDQDTIVEYEGRRYRPENLEAGDEVEIAIHDTGSRLWAQEVYVLRSVSETAATDRFDPDLRGTVNRVDPRARIIELERVEPLLSTFDTRRDDYIVLRYDAQTRVEFEGRLYSPENLEPGDVISVDTRSIEDDLLAEHILVVSDVNQRTSLVD